MSKNTRGILSNSVNILCNILGACPGGFIEGIRCSTSFNGRRTLCASLGGVLPYTGYIGICRGIGYGF